MEPAHGTSDAQEPTTPMWLPAVGAALFIVVGIWWTSRPSADPQQAAPAAVQTTAADAGAPAAAH
jgi:hypothetical protein